MRLLVHAVHNGEEKNAKWVGPNCFCSLTTIDNEEKSERRTRLKKKSHNFLYFICGNFLLEALRKEL